MAGDVGIVDRAVERADARRDADNTTPATVSNVDLLREAAQLLREGNHHPDHDAGRLALADLLDDEAAQLERTARPDSEAWGHILRHALAVARAVTGGAE